MQLKRSVEMLLDCMFQKELDKKHLVPDIYGKSAKKQRSILEDELFYPSAHKIIGEGRTYLYYDRLFYIYQALKNLANSNAISQPVMMEVGVFKGGGSAFIASIALKLFSNNFQHYCVDTFEGHSIDDIPSGVEGAHNLRKFKDTAYDDVCEYLKSYKEITVLKGRIQDCEQQLKDIKFSFIHLDVDIYEPTKYALEYYSKRLADYAIIIVDDYGFLTSPGIKASVDEFLVANTNFTGIELMTGQYMLIKNRG